MGYYEYDTGYFEPSEFDEKCDELKQYLLDHAKKELVNKIAKLEAENESMKDIVSNYNQKVKELELKKQKYNFDEKNLRREIYQEVRKERLSDLLEPLKFYAWSVRNHPIPKPKCEKCDEKREIHFKSPSGKDMVEACECQKGTPHYVPVKEDLVEFRLEHYNGEYLAGWYRERDVYKEDDNYYGDTNSKYIEDKMYKGQPYESIESPWNVYFESENAAQKYANWLNAKETPDD